jgi:hypothetical protein
LNIGLIYHPVEGAQWPTLLDADLLSSKTAYKVGKEVLKLNSPPPLLGTLKGKEGSYRHVITEKFVRVDGALRLVRIAWNARAFVFGQGVDCD